MKRIIFLAKDLFMPEQTRDLGIARLFLAGVADVLAGLAGVGVLVLNIIVFMDVIGRHTPLKPPWGAGGGDISQIVMALISCFGLAYCWYAGSHVRIEVLRDFSSSLRFRATLDAAASLVGMLFVVVIAWSIMEESLYGNIPVTRAIGLSQISTRLVFGIAMAHFSVVLARSFWSYVCIARGGKPKAWTIIKVKGD